MAETLPKIVYISTVPPRKCGLATFSRDLAKAVSKTVPKPRYSFIAMEKSADEKNAYGEQVWSTIRDNHPEDYRAAAELINLSGANIVSLQHEFGIFGGFDGRLVLTLLENLRVPVVTSLHTTPVFPETKYAAERLDVLREITKYSAAVAVTSSEAVNLLVKEHDFPDDKLHVIRHGTPDIDRLSSVEIGEIRSQIGCKTKNMLITFGLISPNKGLEYAIQGLATLKNNPDWTYYILGEMHPNKSSELFKKQANYLEYLRSEVHRLHLEDRVIFQNKYFEDKELIRYLQAADIMITPYLVPEQVSSGVLSWGVAAGLCMVTTPFLYTRDLVNNERGEFIEYASAESVARVVGELLEKPERIESCKKASYEYGNQLSWSKVGAQYRELFSSVIKS